MEGIEECLSDSRMAVFMCNATDDPAREAHHVEQLMGKRVDGIIVTARRADKRAKLTRPGRHPGDLCLFAGRRRRCVLPLAR